jgi:hypothetical protein
MITFIYINLKILVYLYFNKFFKLLNEIFQVS